jgi:tungstate transport system substrate-binding protein
MDGLRRRVTRGGCRDTDRGTWISFANKGELTILVEGDTAPFNPDGVIRADPTKHPHVKAEASQAFIDWLLSPEGGGAIADCKISAEQPLGARSV